VCVFLSLLIRLNTNPQKKTISGNLKDVCACVCVRVCVYRKSPIFHQKSPQSFSPSRSSLQLYTNLRTYRILHYLQPRISIVDLVLKVSFATFYWKESHEIEIRHWDWITLQMQEAVYMWHDSFIYVIQICVTWLIHMRSSKYEGNCPKQATNLIWVVRG